MRVLSSLSVGESGVLAVLNLAPGVQNHLMYMGFVLDARVTVLHRAPSGDPTVYSVDGIEIALRHETAREIQVVSVRTIRETEASISAASAEQPVQKMTEAIR